jgi:phosphatidylglycerol lysyltransferase
LLAHTISAFVLAAIGVILWILFRPSRKITLARRDFKRVEQLLNKYSVSSEDYFKLWPRDKQYFWNQSKTGFITYKIVGPIAFALADPICPKNKQRLLTQQFIAWARARRLKACVLPIYEDSLAMYKDNELSELQIGASALIEIKRFLNETSQDKWWRWKKNRAVKSGYEYACSQPPHARQLINDLQKVSDGWLAIGGHQERGFALGHFDRAYIQKCAIHYLKDAQGQVVAFTNQLPEFNPSKVATVDLLRYRPDSGDPMPYLLLKTIENIISDGRYSYFDLGFVPFTGATDPAVAIAKVLSTGRFSARGLEQFKNKFGPQWQPNYLAYDGDLGDLTLIAINLERLMDLQTT